jgi:hypothetical protein
MAQHSMSQARQTVPELGFTLVRGRVSGMAPVHKGRPQQFLRRGPAAMTDRSHENSLDDVQILVRIVSACTLGLWAFAGGLLIGVFLFP